MPLARRRAPVPHRGFSAFWAALLALVPLATTAPRAQAVPTVPPLPWLSGVAGGDPIAFEAWRGRPLDFATVYFGKLDWQHLLASARGRPRRPRMAVGFPMLPESHRGQLHRCAAGSFDRQMAAVRNAMLAKGWAGAFVRLGWEGNRAASFPWAALGDGTTWRGCFRRWVDALNPVTDATTTPPTRTRNFVIVWNMGNRGTFPHPIENLWPGEGYVDVVGSQFFDRCPPVRAGDFAGWRAKLDARDAWGNPAGPRAWLEYARAKGKPYAVPEWGIGGSRTLCRRPGVDSPFVVRQMHGFLRANAADVAFESYFNALSDGGSGSTALNPPLNPLAAAAYRELWGAAPPLVP